uniref:Uncharacterized protein n=1 Tax=uncultured euryarchaeote Rifle_16ft_4_minimus_37884 TaxID=1665196 RepID=A0A0H4T5V1_9EURY|nr:hypothetical protein [uncultured euryarchaeote Rifle_16ft_4_minimus_37884]
MGLEGAAISIAAAIFSVGFAALVTNQWIERRKPYQVAWSLGLVLYAIAAFTQFYAEAYGWTPNVYKVYYLVAATLVAVLGVGSTLLVHRRAGIGFALYTGVVFVGFAWTVAGATVGTLQASTPAGYAMPDTVRIWSPLFTVPGSVALIGIAAYSYWRTRLAFNAWIAAGALIVAVGGTLARFDVGWFLYAAELIGIAVMFRGFLVSQDLAKSSHPDVPQSAPL